MAYALRLVKPAFDDPLVDLLVDLEKQRTPVMLTEATTPLPLFTQLKGVFHLMESLGSARIEGNRTTVAELIDRQLEAPEPKEAISEILNIETGLAFIENLEIQHPGAWRVDHGLVRELHRQVTASLSPSREGDAHPGQYRQGPVRITGAAHTPPSPDAVFELMDELWRFLEAQDPPKYDLIKLAIAHHRFAWIHPFANGNGRTVRLLSYALLLKAGFQVAGAPGTSRLLNPTAVFCADRNRYYDQLAQADTGSDEGLLAWCRYVLGGLRDELNKVEKLLDAEWLRREILAPAIDELFAKNGLNRQERLVLQAAASRESIQNADVKPLLGGIQQVQVSRILGELKRQNLLIPLEETSRRYQIGLTKSPLLRTVLRQLDRQGFLPFKDEI